MFKTIEIFGHTYELRYSYNIGTNSDGIDVSNPLGRHIGSIHGETFPDENDADAVYRFNNVVEDWIIENEN
jgi:hypothetical protein